MKKRKLKSFVVPTIYTMTILVICASMYLIEKTINNSKFKSKDEIQYVDKEIVEENIYVPVVSLSQTIQKPFLNEEIKINKEYYDKESENTSQENALIFYENTYIQNTGVDYTYNSQFDIVSILDGEVIEITENELLGKTIKIKHDKELISVYQTLSEVTIKENDHVAQGQIIAKSGTSKVYPKNNNLHFELYHNGNCVNPANYYNKNIEELS